MDDLNLEQLIKDRPAPPPHPALRARILEGIKHEQQSQQPLKLWHWAIGAAALFLLCANLFSSIHSHSFSPVHSPENNQSDQLVNHLQREFPELTSRDYRRLTLLGTLHDRPAMSSESGISHHDLQKEPQ